MIEEKPSSKAFKQVSLCKPWSKWTTTGTFALFAIGIKNIAKSSNPLYGSKTSAVPKITGEPVSAEFQSDDDIKATGSFSKKPIWTILPYVPEQGLINFSPRGVKGVAELEVVAAGNGVKIMNLDSYAGKDNILVGSTPLYKKTGAVSINKIKIITDTYEYTCNLNR